MLSLPHLYCNKNTETLFATFPCIATFYGRYYDMKSGWTSAKRRHTTDRWFEINVLIIPNLKSTITVILTLTSRCDRRVAVETLTHLRVFFLINTQQIYDTT